MRPITPPGALFSIIHEITAMSSVNCRQVIGR